MNQTCLARLSEADSEFSLTRLAQCIKECGPNHFDPRGTTPFSYIQTLLVLGEWSASVCYLLERGEAVAALLLATAFYAYGLLGGADNVFVTCLLRLIRTAGMTPVVAGELVGVPSMKYTGSYYSTSTVEGIGMAIPINAAKPLIEEVLSGKTVSNGTSADSSKDSSSVAPESRPRMGVKVKTISASNSGAVAAGALPSGAYIDEVEKNSPAEKAGLQVKDIVVEVDGTIVSSSQEMVNAMASKKAGDTVEIKYFRMEGDESKWESYDDIQGDYHTVTVELAMLDETHS